MLESHCCKDCVVKQVGLINNTDLISFVQFQQGFIPVRIAVQ